MSAAEPGPVQPPVVQVESNGPVERRSSATFGVITFILAVLVFLIEPAVNALVNTATFLDQASTISGTVMGIEILAALGVFVLALVAALRRRGTGWAVAAMSIAVVGNSYVRSAIFELFGLLFRAIFGTPVY